MSAQQIMNFITRGLRPVCTQSVDVSLAIESLIADYEAPGGPKAEIEAMAAAAVAANDPGVITGTDANGAPPLTYGGIVLAMANYSAQAASVREVGAVGISLFDGCVSISPRYAS